MNTNGGLNVTHTYTMPVIREEKIKREKEHDCNREERERELKDRERIRRHIIEIVTKKERTNNMY